MAPGNKSKSTSNGNKNNAASSQNKKRKQYLPYNKPVKKKGSYPLHPGVQGFFITCDGGRERQASHEAIDVLDSFYEELLHGPKSTTRPVVFANKPPNKKIKFSYSDSSSDDDGEEEAAILLPCSDNIQNKTDVKSDPQNIDETSHTSQTVADDKDDDKNQELQRVDEVNEPPAKKQSPEADAPKKEELSIDKQIEAELKEMGDRNKRRFVNLDPGCNGLAFVQMHKRDGDPSPKDIVQHMMTSLATTKKHVSRFILRLVPVEVTCYASEDEITKVMKPIVERYFPLATENPQKFAVLYEARANSGVDRMKIINSVAKSIPLPHKVDLSDPDKSIIVQIVKTICLIGVVEKYKELSKYNLRQLTSSG